MKQIVITLDSPDILSLEKQGDKEALSKVHDLGSFLAFNFSQNYRSLIQQLLRPLLKALRSKLEKESHKSSLQKRVLIQIKEVLLGLAS